MISHSFLASVIGSLQVLAIWSVVCFATVSAYGQPESPLVYNFGEPDERSGWRFVTDERVKARMLFPTGVEVREAKQRFAEGDFAVTFYSSYSTFGFFSVGIAHPLDPSVFKNLSAKKMGEMSDMIVRSHMPRPGIRASSGKSYKKENVEGREYSYELDDSRGAIFVTWNDGVLLFLISQPKKTTDSRVAKFFLESNQGLLR
jgi:hypothetical protein